MTHNVKLWNGKDGKLCHSNAVVDASIVILYFTYIPRCANVTCNVIYMCMCMCMLMWVHKICERLGYG